MLTNHTQIQKKTNEPNNQNYMETIKIHARTQNVSNNYENEQRSERPQVNRFRITKIA